MNALLYCTKNGKKIYDEEGELINGTIACECKIETERIYNLGFPAKPRFVMKNRNEHELEQGSCLDYEQLHDYLVDEDGYAIHLKNLFVPYTLDSITSREGGEIKRAPQNMMYVDVDYPDETGQTKTETMVLISVRPQWIEKILKGEKTIEVRRKVLKEMIEND